MKSTAVGAGGVVHHGGHREALRRVHGFCGDHGYGSKDTNLYSYQIWRACALVHQIHCKKMQLLYVEMIAKRGGKKTLRRRRSCWGELLMENIKNSMNKKGDRAKKDIGNENNQKRKNFERF